jgi:hypothetical protein
MATFSLGTSGVTPGAPGVYINEQAGKLANADLAGFDTVYMLVETEEDVPVTQFPFNTPIAITSLNDYKELIRVGNSTVPDSRIPLLSYNCVNEFFENSQIGDLRVVRVGTPNEIVELEFLPSGTKTNSSSLPSGLVAGNTVFVQMTINGQKLVAGDGSTGYTANGEWLGVPVEIPVNYVAGDEANNRKISSAIVEAVVDAIETNPAIRTSVYVRSFGLTYGVNPASNSESGYVSIAATTFNGSVNVVTQVLPVGSNYVFMQNAYNSANIVGRSVELERVPQDYTQCIATAFDGQQDQGYLITPTAYAQFDAEGRAAVGAAAAAHCQDNNYKWMALADPGPYLVTDINEYSAYTPHAAAADLVTGLKYLVDNVIYEWVGTDVSYDRLNYQELVFGVASQTPVDESANLVAADTKVGMLDSATYTIVAGTRAGVGTFNISTTNYWPVTLPIQKVSLTANSVGNEFQSVSIQGQAGTFNLSGTEVYIVAPPYDVAVDSDYSSNYVYIATTAGDASSIYDAAVLAGGTKYIDLAGTAPAGAVYISAPTGSQAIISYADSYWDLPVEINGQTSDLIENISGADAGVNTLHLPGTLQDPTGEYVLNWFSRTFVDPSAQISSASGITGITNGTAVFSCLSHGLGDGDVIFFNRSVKVTLTSGSDVNLVSATTKQVTFEYYVKPVTTDTFVLANSLANYSTGNFITLPTGTVGTIPTVAYSQITGRNVNSTGSVPLTTLPLIRGRKYGFDSNSIWSQSLDASIAPTGVEVAGNLSQAIYPNNSATITGKNQITPYGENIDSISLCGYLPELNLVAPTDAPVSLITNAYCVPTVDQFFSANAYLVPALESLYVGDYDPTAASTIGPIASGGLSAPAPATTATDGLYYDQPLTAVTGSGTGGIVYINVFAGNIAGITVANGGQGYQVGDILDLPANFGGTQLTVDAIDAGTGAVSAVAPGTIPTQLGVQVGDGAAQLETIALGLSGCYFDVVGGPGLAPDGQAVVVGDRIAAVFDGSTTSYVVVPADSLGGDMTTVATVCYGAQTEFSFTPEQTPPTNLWRFDAITSSEIISDALRGVGFNGVPQAVEVEAGVDNVNRLYEDSQRYFNPFGFIAYYGPYIENGAGQFIPPSPYVTGVAVRRYRAEGYQFPPAGVKYQLADAISTQIPVNSAQQNLLNPDGCNVIRTLPGYPQTAVFIWGGRTRVNSKDAQQRLYQFVNTRVILNVVYGSLRSAFDSQIFNVIDGFGVIYNQIISVGNSILNQLYVRGALYGAKPSDAFQVICDNRINSAEDLENGIVNAKVFVTPVPTLERIQIDLIRVALGKMQQELDVQGLGS